MNYQNIKGLNQTLALYMLTVRAPDPPFAAVDTYIFPLSPQRVRKTFTAMTAIYDTAGTPDTAGVARVVDSYGVAPFVYEIEGTTGWDYHSTDGYAFSGLASIRRIQDMFLNYARNNQIQRQNNNPNSYFMEFADFFTGEFYQVEPIGPQEIRASDRAPLLQYYRFRLAGVAPIEAPYYEDTSTDPTASMLSTSGGSAIRNTTAQTSLTLGLY